MVTVLQLIVVAVIAPAQFMGERVHEADLLHAGPIRGAFPIVSHKHTSLNNQLLESFSDNILAHRAGLAALLFGFAHNAEAHIHSVD